MGTATDYCKQIKQGLRRHANFPPDVPIALGDYGRMQDHVFERVGNVGQLGVTFGVVRSTGKSGYSFKSQGNVDVALVGKGELDAAGAAAIRASVDIHFSRENAVFFAAAGVEVLVIDDLRALEASLIALLGEGRWEADFYVVTEVNTAAKTTALSSASSESAIKLEASSPAIEAVQLGDASLELQVKRSRNIGLEIVTEAGHTPLMQLARLRGFFHDSLRPDGEGWFGLSADAPAPIRLAADADTESARPTSADMPVGSPLLSAAALSVPGPASTPGAATASAEGRASARQLGLSQVSFDKARALNLYLPLLRASYEFSHGNQTPTLPAGVERLGTVVAREDAAASVTVLSPAAQAAVDNDRRALDAEAAASIAAGIANPDGFGFVVRMAGTTEFLVGIRGTQTPEEWVKNFTAIPQPWNEVPGFGLVHLGFEQMWRRVRRSVFDGLAGVPAGARVTFVGHSLGGAMATLGAADVKTNLGVDVDVDLWTVGCPRVGQVRFRKHFNALVPRALRVANQGDIVPHVPSVVELFMHVGLEVDVKGTNGNPHSLNAYENGIRKLPDTVASLAAGVVSVMAAPTP
ncbi:MAG: lipase family protein [Vicinamibacterales bacterium]